MMTVPARADTDCKSWLLGICTSHYTPAEQAEINAQKRLEALLRDPARAGPELERRLRKQKGYRPVKTLAVASGNVVVDSWEGEWMDPDSGQHMAGRGIEILKLRGRLVDELDAVFHSWPTSGS